MINQLGQNILDIKPGEEVVFQSAKDLSAKYDKSRGNSWTNEDPAINTLDDLNALLDKLDPDVASSS